MVLGSEVRLDLRLGRYEGQHLRAVGAGCGQGTAAVAGLPLAAKVAQEVRMLAANACWPTLNVPGSGAFGGLNRYWVSEERVAAGGSGAKRSGVLLSLNS